MTKCDEHVWRPRHLEMNSPGWGTSSLLMRAKSALRRLHVDLFTKIWTHRVTFFFCRFFGMFDDHLMMFGFESFELNSLAPSVSHICFTALSHM